MTTRARHEAKWTHEDATVKGKFTHNRGWWMLVVAFAAVALVSTFAYGRLMNFQDVTFELRHCQQPLTADSTWAEVQAAGCDPAPVDGAAATHWNQGSATSPDTTGETSWTFERLPVNTVVNAIEFDLPEPAVTVVVAEPDKQTVRRALTSDVSDTTWTGMIGDRASTTMWVLVTPEG